MEVVMQFDKEEPIVAMIEFKGMVILATTRRLFCTDENLNFNPVTLVEETDG